MGKVWDINSKLISKYVVKNCAKICENKKELKNGIRIIKIREVRKVRKVRKTIGCIIGWLMMYIIYLNNSNYNIVQRLLDFFEQWL